MGIFSGIATAFTQGGIWMWAILFVQIVSIAIIFERVMALFISRQIGQKKKSKSFEKSIKQGDLEAAIEIAESMKKHPIAHVVYQGSQAALDFGGKEDIQARIDEVLLDNKSSLDKRTGFLAMLGNTATLLGLLGTIVGLIQAFGAVAGLEAAEKAVELTKGVSMAMNTTAYGLITAIPALFMYAVLQNRTNQLMEDLSQGALRVFNWLSFRQQVVAPKKRKTAAAPKETKSIKRSFDK